MQGVKLNRFIGIALTALAVAVVAAGCGSSSDSDTLSKTEWTTQANAICTAGNKETDNAFDGLGDKPSSKQIEQVVTEKLLPSIRSQIDDVTALKPPEEIQDQVDAFLKQANADYAKIEADPSAAAQDDAFAETNKLGNELGLTACASG